MTDPSVQDDPNHNSNPDVEDLDLIDAPPKRPRGKPLYSEDGVRAFLPFARIDTEDGTVYVPCSPFNGDYGFRSIYDCSPAELGAWANDRIAKANRIIDEAREYKQIARSIAQEGFATFGEANGSRR